MIVRVLVPIELIVLFLLLLGGRGSRGKVGDHGRCSLYLVNILGRCRSCSLSQVHHLLTALLTQLLLLCDGRCVSHDPDHPLLELLVVAGGGTEHIELQALLVRIEGDEFWVRANFVAT